MHMLLHSVAVLESEVGTRVWEFELLVCGRPEELQDLGILGRIVSKANTTPPVGCTAIQGNRVRQALCRDQSLWSRRRSRKSLGCFAGRVPQPSP